MEAEALDGGFAAAPQDAAYAFRAIMTAMARPGEIVEVGGVAPPAPLSVATGVLLLTLCDPDTPLYFAPASDTPEVRQWITFHTGAPIVAAGEARFAVGRWAELSGLAFPIGTPEYPDRSATLIVESDTLEPRGAILRGPGIEKTAELSLPESAAFQSNAALFPLGLDFFFTSGARLAGLPRTTKVR